MCAVTFGPKSQNHRNVGGRGLWRSPEPPKKQLVAILCPLLPLLKTVCLCCLYNSPLSGCRLQLDCFSVSSSARSWERDCSCSDDLLRVGGLRRAVKMQGRKLIVLNVLICSFLCNAHKVRHPCRSSPAAWLTTGREFCLPGDKSGCSSVSNGVLGL